MKLTSIIMGALAIGAVSFTSCKKDYTCTCTTTINSVSSTTVYDLNNQTRADADEACDRLENDKNSQNGPATTNCNL